MRVLSGERLLAEKKRLQGLRQFEEEKRAAHGCAYIIGVDEVGRGPLCGPVVSAACILPADCEILYLNDSKKLSEKRRGLLDAEIRQKALSFGLSEVSPQRIDEINILQATFEAMRGAVSACVSEFLKAHPLPGLSSLQAAASSGQFLVLVDGNRTIPGLSFPQECIVKGDGSSASIAAASILAKVSRDTEMLRYDALYPGYGFARNKGYGTAEHYAGLERLGKTPIHRESFLKGL